MKLVKTASGKQTIKISKKEWQNIGKRSGWMKIADVLGPKTYITKTDDGFALIHQGSPLTASNRSLKDAFDVAKRYNLKVYNMYENGEFRPISEDERKLGEFDQPISTASKESKIVTSAGNDSSKYMEILKYEGQSGFDKAMDNIVAPGGRVYDVTPQQYEQRLVEHFGDFSILPKELKNAIGFSIAEQEYRQTVASGKKSKIVTSAGKKCDSCEVVMVNGVRTHERGCPDAWKDYKEECKWCGSEFKPKEKGQRCCSKSCEKSYNS